MKLLDVLSVDIQKMGVQNLGALAKLPKRLALLTEKLGKCSKFKI